jgi:hypothetical protein
MNKDKDSREVHWSTAEQHCGRRLDRRRKYAVINGELCSLGRWTDTCSGCCETVDGHNVHRYPRDKKHGCLIGGGCDECGYTGKRRQSFWGPVFDADYVKGRGKK